MRETIDKTAIRSVGRVSLYLGSALLAASLAACKSNSGGNEAPAVDINGAGSTFVYPVMSRWTADFLNSHPNVHINYQSIGSGGGVQQVKSGTVDFGASDYALTDQQLGEMKPVVQIPESAGPVCIIYSLPGLSKPLQLSADSIAGIFLGKIITWHDPLLVKDNPGVNLPNTKVVVAHRTDGSGTTAAFTTYLSAVSPEWKSKVGTGGAVSWPAGVGGKGSEGVTAMVRQFPGGIGYVELTYAQQNKLDVASVKNQAGKYVAPSTASTTAAIAAFSDELSKDPRIPIANPPASAADAYPISTLTFLIIPKDGPDKAKRTALRDFARYVITDGQATAGALNYAPLPDGVKAYDRQKIQQMTAAGQPIP
jgi:phosphate transport system substrate-binding protein